MFIEVSPGTGRVLTRAGASRSPTRCPTSTRTRSTRRSTADTRPYLKLLVSGAGKGLSGRGTDLREVFRRFEPVHRDLARVTRATARRRVALKR